MTGGKYSMEYGVYLESSIVDLKPRVLDFLTAIVEKAKQAKDYAISFKKKDLAEMTGKDIRTTARYLKELEERNIITTRGVRGRAGGTVVMFNTDLIRFDTSDKAFINSNEPISIDDIVEKKFPKKEKEPKKTTRNRRTKQQMVEANILKGMRQSKNDKLNDELEKLGGVPNWEWFQKTDDPVGNYRTYLITRLYNRYAVLFTDRHNVDVELGLVEGNKVPTVSSSYDVLPEEPFGSSRWAQFEKFRIFCEENGIDPAVYLSAQFNRSIFDSSVKNNKKMLPFANALMSAGSYEVFKQYCGFQKEYSATYKSYQQIPMKFADDFVVRAVAEAYETAETRTGLLQYRYAIQDFFTGTGFGAEEDALLRFYDITADNLRKQGVTFKTRDTVKKYVLLQSMIQTSGASGLPSYLILGSEMTQVLLASITNLVGPTGNPRELKEQALGMLTYPSLPVEEQKKKGKVLYYQMNALHETPKVLRLIMERKGLLLSLADLNVAFKEYGKEKIPVDDYSMLDTAKVISFIEREGKEEEPEINHEDLVTKREWELEGSIANDDNLENALSDFLNLEE
jgi:hypothetical protein